MGSETELRLMVAKFGMRNVINELAKITREYLELKRPMPYDSAKEKASIENLDLIATNLEAPMF